MHILYKYAYTHIYIYITDNFLILVFYSIIYYRAHYFNYNFK